jgi:hypothetical protein
MPEDSGYYYEQGEGDLLPAGLYIEIHSVGQQVNVNEVWAGDVQLEMTGAMSFFAPPMVLSPTGYIDIKILDTKGVDVTSEASNVTIESKYNVGVSSMTPKIYLTNYDTVLFSKLQSSVVVHIYF